MPNFKLFGYTEEEVRELKKKMKKIFQGSTDLEEMVVTTIHSTVEFLNNNRKTSYIEISDSDPGRGRILLMKLSHGLKEDIELTPIDIFVLADEKFVFDIDS